MCTIVLWCELYHIGSVWQFLLCGNVYHLCSVMCVTALVMCTNLWCGISTTYTGSVYRVRHYYQMPLCSRCVPLYCDVCTTHFGHCYFGGVYQGCCVVMFTIILVMCITLYNDMCLIMLGVIMLVSCTIILYQVVVW